MEQDIGHRQCTKSMFIDQEFAFDLEWLRYAEHMRDMFFHTANFIIEGHIRFVCDDTQMKMSYPRVKGFLVGEPSFFWRLETCSVVRARVMLFGSQRCFAPVED